MGTSAPVMISTSTETDGSSISVGEAKARGQIESFRLDLESARIRARVSAGTLTNEEGNAQLQQLSDASTNLNGQLTSNMIDALLVAQLAAEKSSPLGTEASAPVDRAQLKANFIKWIGSSGIAAGADGKPTKDVKPGNRMHYYKMFNVAGLNETNQKFTDEELDCLAEYLLTLK